MRLETVMQILDSDLAQRARRDIIEPLLHNDISAAVQSIPYLLDALYANIPDNKRISYGRVHTIKVLAHYIHSQLNDSATPGFTPASKLFESSISPNRRGKQPE